MSLLTSAAALVWQSASPVLGSPERGAVERSETEGSFRSFQLFEDPSTAARSPSPFRGGIRKRILLPSRKKFLTSSSTYGTLSKPHQRGFI